MDSGTAVKADTNIPTTTDTTAVVGTQILAGTTKRETSGHVGILTAIDIHTLIIGVMQNETIMGIFTMLKLTISDTITEMSMTAAIFKST